MPEITLNQKLKEQISDAEAKTDSDIRKARKNFEDGAILIRGPGCISYIKNLRNKALGYFLPIKQEIYQGILDSLVQGSSVENLGKLQKLLEELNSQSAQQRKVTQDKARIKSEIKSLSKYDKFMLYGDLNTKRKDQGGKSSIKSKVLQAQKDYEAKRKSDTILGILVSIIFAIMDFNIIYNVFLSSNMSLSSALISAFLSAIMLDIPPYVLGNLLQRKNDRKRLWVLRGQPDGKHAEVDLRPYIIGSRLLVSAIVLFFLMYLALRVILFLGGGDFDLAIHFLLSWEFDFATVEFNSSDFISMLFPIVTSAVAFVFGLMRYTPYVGHIEKTVVIIDSELKDQADKCSSAIIECEKEKRNISLQLSQAKREIWTYYFKQQPMPKSNNEFWQKVSSEFQKKNLQICTETYRAHCTHLRESAEGSLKRINAELALAVAIPMEINSMALSPEEKATLDKFWVTKTGAMQHEETQHHIKKIEEMIQELVQPNSGGHKSK